MLNHSPQASSTYFARFSGLRVCYVYFIICFSVVAPENVNVGSDAANVSGANASAKEVHKDETSEKIQSPPPLVEMVHGKQMNSVAHDLLGSIDEMSPFVTEVFNVKTDQVSSHTEYNTLKSKLAEDNVTGMEILLDQAMLVAPHAADNTTQTSPSIPTITPIAGKRLPLEVPSLPDVDPPAPEPPIFVNQLGSLPKKNETDDIPSFNEWANKKMAEVEKNKGENHTVGTPKIRLKNYASPDCGAKVVGSNPEAVSPSAVLSPSRDDYMLNPCNVKIWFVVELCESIQPQRVEIANFELFSSSPHNLSIWVSDRHPSREWSLVAVVQAKDERNVQSFPLPRLPHFAKYVKVELHSHYGSEHYCPVSLFKAYGTSELEVLDSSDNDGDDGDEVSPDDRPSVFEEGDESLSKLPDAVKGMPALEEKKPGDDIFRTAKAAVLSIVQKAAQVLGNGGARNNSCLNVTTSSQCLTPGYQVVCNDCSDQFYYRLYDIMCCNGRKLKELLENNFVYSVVTKSPLCSTIGLEFSTKNHVWPESSGSELAIGMTYLRALLGDDTLAALCNYLAISKRKTALNISHDKGNAEEVPPEEGQSVTNEKIDLPTPVQPLDSSQIKIELTVSRDEPEVTISPTKTLPTERNLPEAALTKKVDAEADLSALSPQEAPPGESKNHLPDEETELAKTTLSPEFALPVDSIPAQPESRKINCLTNAEEKLFIKWLVEAIVQRYPELERDQVMNRLGYCQKLLKKCCSRTDKHNKRKKQRGNNPLEDTSHNKFSYAQNLISRVMKENPHFDIKKVKRTVNELLNFVLPVSESDTTDSNYCSSESSLDVELGSRHCTVHDTAFDVIMEGVLGKKTVCDTARLKPFRCRNCESSSSFEPRLKLPDLPACAKSCNACQSQTPFMSWKDTDFAKLQSKLNNPHGAKRKPEITKKVNSYSDDVCRNLLGEAAFDGHVPKKSFSQGNPCKTEIDECSKFRPRKSRSTSDSKTDKAELRRFLEEICKSQKGSEQSKYRPGRVPPNQSPAKLSSLDIPNSRHFQSVSKRQPAKYVCQKVPFGNGRTGSCVHPADYKFGVPPQLNQLEGYYETDETYFPQASYTLSYPAQYAAIKSYYQEPFSLYDSISPGATQVRNRTYDSIGRDDMPFKCEPSEYQSSSKYKSIMQLPTQESSFAERNPCSVNHCLPAGAGLVTNRLPKTLPNSRRLVNERPVVSPGWGYSYASPQHSSPQYGVPGINPYC